MSKEQDKRAIDDSPTKSQKAHQVLSHVKAKAKDILTLGHESDEDAPKTKTPLETAQNDLETNPAFNPNKFLNDRRLSAVKVGGKLLGVLETAVETIIHPKQSIKSRATRTAARKLSKGRPYISRKADLDFLDAYDEQKRVESSRSTSDNDEEAGMKDSAISTKSEVLAELEERRESMRVAWVTDRHVQRVKVIERHPGRFPPREYFEEKGVDGVVKFRYDKWLAYTLLFYSHRFTVGYIDDFENLPFSLNALRRHVERLVIVSDPAQVIVSRIMRVYRWENPYETSKWAVLYTILWYTSHIMTFFYAYIIYRVLRNLLAPASLEDLRESMERTMDRGATAFKVAELMDRHGNEDWLDPLVEQLGPEIQLQINDLANMLEVLDNFYNWRSPFMTLGTLFFVFVCCLICLLADSNFGLKIMWFISGLSFFIGFPISSHYPQFRHLVSPPKWVLWDIPTHAEWSIMYLQERANKARLAFETNSQEQNDNEPVKENESAPRIKIDGVTSDNDSEDSSVEDEYESAAESVSDAPNDPFNRSPVSTDILSIRCTHNLIPGKLIISSHGFRFQSSISRSSSHTPKDTNNTAIPTNFTYPYSALHQMRKRHSSKRKTAGLKAVAGFEALEIYVLDDGETEEERMFVPGAERRTRCIVLDNMRGRDKAFNALLGFSGLKWQNLMAGWE